MTTLAVAGLSARMLAQAATQSGYTTVALDVFGDRDTLQACQKWMPIGHGAWPVIDADQTLAALHQLAQCGDVIGWIAGSHFETLPDLLQAGAAVLPLIGTAPDAVRSVRNPRVFFDCLASHGIPYPDTQYVAPDRAEGWLRKQALGSGGWHVQRASESEPSPVFGWPYFQRAWPGKPMSATFIANGHDACVLGFNELIVKPVNGHPFAFCGAVGPVPISPTIQTTLTHAVRHITASMHLKGLCSLDFMLDGHQYAVLEVNPRPPASMALYTDHMGPKGLIYAHVQACMRAEWPVLPARAPNKAPVEGFEMVYADQSWTLTEAMLSQWATRPDCHDLPSTTSHFAVGSPICTVSAQGLDSEQVRARLSIKREAWARHLKANT